MKTKEIPWFNRPGAKLKRKGVSALSDAELLAIVLGRGDKNLKSCMWPKNSINL